MKTLIERLNQDTNYLRGAFTRETKRRWLRANLREATTLQSFNGNKKPHRSLNDYKDELLETDWETIKILKAIWSLDPRRSYTTTPVIQEAKEYVRTKRMGNFREVLLLLLRNKLEYMLNRGYKHVLFKDALGEDLTMIEKVFVSKIYKCI